MSLNVVRRGNGPRIVLLHGWALNSHVWDQLVPHLAAGFTVECIDLPGHGGSPWEPGFTDLQSLARSVALQVSPGSIVLGWSLGAQVALQLAATRPDSVRALVLVAATPRFLRANDWEFGVDEQVLATFADHLEADFQATVREFLALQVRGDERAHATLRTLRRDVLAAGTPDPRALAAGLDVLRRTDLRDVLQRVRAPTLVIAGERDRLTPPEASRELAARLPQARFHLVERAAHAPFLSHVDEFLGEVLRFLSRMHPEGSMPTRAAASRPS